MEHGKPHDAVHVLMEGFGGIIFRALVDKMQKG
jgi:hypothetical protein